MARTKNRKNVVLHEVAEAPRKAPKPSSWPRQIPPEDRPTLAKFHENAYRMGWGAMLSILERVVMLQDARRTTFSGASLERCQPDAAFVRGMLDAAGQLFGDAAPLMRSDFGVELQEAIMDDFWDNSREALRKAYDREPKIPYWLR